MLLWRLRGLAIACWIRDHYHPCSNLGVGISEGCFILDFASLPLEVVRPIYPTICAKVAAKHRSSSYHLCVTTKHRTDRDVYHAIQVSDLFRHVTDYTGICDPETPSPRKLYVHD